FTLKINTKNIAVELFRRTNKALTITGCTLDPAIRELQNVDKVFAWALVWGERRKAAATQEKVASEGNGFDSRGCRYSIDEIEQFVREGALPRHGRSQRNAHSRISRQRMNPRIESSTMITMMISARSCLSTTPACRGSMPTAIPTRGRSNPG